MFTTLERKQPSASRAKTSVYTVKNIYMALFKLCLKKKEPPLSRSSKAALNLSVSSMFVMWVGSWL